LIGHIRVGDNTFEMKIGGKATRVHMDLENRDPSGGLLVDERNGRIISK